MKKKRNKNAIGKRPVSYTHLDKYDQTSFVRGCVPRDRSLLGISPTDENGTFDVLVATFENDWIIGRDVYKRQAR